jgi:hypothetical protein
VCALVAGEACAGEGLSGGFYTRAMCVGGGGWVELELSEEQRRLVDRAFARAFCAAPVHEGETSAIADAEIAAELVAAFGGDGD